MGDDGAKQKPSIQIFLDQQRAAFKRILQKLAEHGVAIRSFTELQSMVIEVESGLPITQQLMIQAYRTALLVSTIEALFKEFAASEHAGLDADTADPGCNQGQQRQANRGPENI